MQFIQGQGHSLAVSPAVVQDWVLGSVHLNHVETGHSDQIQFLSVISLSFSSVLSVCECSQL